MREIEYRFYEIAIRFFSKYSNKQIDWEQRRYEIAKDLFVHSTGYNVKRCVERADELIAELKKNQEN